MKTDLRKLKPEHKTGIIMGVSAMFFSLIVSIAVGNTVTYSIGRGFLFALLFAVIGAGAVIILKKFIPELFASFGETESPVETSDNVEIVGEKSVGETAVSNAPTSGSESFAAEANLPEVDQKISQFEPLSQHLKNVPGDSLDTKKGKLGRHVLQEKSMKYEPKIAAEAIRTMMSKDQ